MVTTLILAFSASIFCCLAAAPMGWLVARTDLPFAKAVRALVTASFVTPPFLGDRLELLAAPNFAAAEQLYRFISGAGDGRPHLHIYTMTG